MEKKLEVTDIKPQLKEGKDFFLVKLEALFDKTQHIEFLKFMEARQVNTVFKKTGDAE